MGKIAFFKQYIAWIIRGDKHEFPHVHIYVTKTKHKASSAKFWIASGELATNKGLTEKELIVCEKLVQQNKQKLWKQWNKVVSGKQVRPVQLTLK